MSVLLHLDTENKKVKENRSNDDSGRDQDELLARGRILKMGLL